MYLYYLKYTHVFIEKLFELISFTTRKVRKFKNREAQCILYFAQHPDTGISEFHKSSQINIFDKKRKRYTKPYRGNLVKVAKKLNDEKILESISEIRPYHYHLTEYGIYCLLYQKTNLYEQAVLYLLSNHKENVIFQSFLSPIFNHTTLQYLNLHADTFCKYLRRCFQEIQLYQKNIKFELATKLLTWQDIVPGKCYKLSRFDYSNLLNFLQNELQLDWVEGASIEKLASNSAIKITHSDKSLFIRMSENNKQAILYFNDKRQYTFHVSELVMRKNLGDIKRHDLIATYTDSQSFALAYLVKGIEMAVEILIEEILSTPLNYWEKNKLSSDTKFCALIKSVKESFQSRLDLLHQLELSCGKPG